MTAPDGSIYIPETGGELVLPNPEDYPKGYGPTYEGEDLTGTWRETTVGKATMELNEDGTGAFNSGVDFTWYAGDGLFFTFYDERFGNTVPGQYNIVVENGATILKEVAEDGAVFER